MKVKNEGKNIRVKVWKNHYLRNQCLVSAPNSRKRIFTRIDGRSYAKMTLNIKMSASIYTIVKL